MDWETDFSGVKHSHSMFTRRETRFVQLNLGMLHQAPTASSVLRPKGGISLVWCSGSWLDAWGLAIEITY
jgi:hypothetical protein